MNGLLTGALRKTGNLKLERAGIMNYFKVRSDSDDEHTDRSQLFDIAIKRAEEIGFIRTKNNVFYVGDTPNDIISGRKAGVPTIIVGTGPWPPKKIQEQNPDLFVENLIIGQEKILKFMSLN